MVKKKIAYSERIPNIISTQPTEGYEAHPKKKVMDILIGIFGPPIWFILTSWSGYKFHIDSLMLFGITSLIGFALAVEFKRQYIVRSLIIWAVSILIIFAIIAGTCKMY